MSSFDNGTILESGIGTILKSSIGTMLDSSIGTMSESSIGTTSESNIGTMLGSYVWTMLESSTESVLHFHIHPTPMQCRKPTSIRHWNVGCRHRNDIVPRLEHHLGWVLIFFKKIVSKCSCNKIKEFSKILKFVFFYGQILHSSMKNWYSLYSLIN